VPHEQPSRPDPAPARAREPRAGAGFFAPPLPRLIAHRGASGTRPENTLAAFRAAVDSGAEMIELDLHLSADGVPVVIHDATLERTTGARGPAARRSAAELAALDAGYRFSRDRGRTFPYREAGVGLPPLREVLDALPDVRFTLEIKTDDPAIDRALASDLGSSRAHDRVLLAAMEGAVVRRLRESFPGVPTNLARDEVAAFLRTGRVPAGGSALQVPERQGLRRIVTAESVAAAHAAGLEVHVWTVNAVPAMRRLLDLGVDGIMTDFPERLREVYRERGLR
jgi:glycerophosphoryl diester phosphodiesterase